MNRPDGMGADRYNERQNMKAAAQQESRGRTLAGTTFRHECRICGANHGTERHTTCPECGRQPYDFHWAVQDHISESERFPFRTGTSWASKRVEILD